MPTWFKIAVGLILGGLALVGATYIGYAIWLVKVAG